MTNEEAEEAVFCHNAAMLHVAQEAYTENDGRELRSKCDYLAECVRERYRKLMRGEPPAAFRPFDRDEIARLLNADMTITYNAICIKGDESVASAETIDDCTYDTVNTDLVREYRYRSAFFDQYAKYLRTGAVVAKSVGCVHAMRLYLRAWKKVSDASESDYCGFRLSAEDAMSVVNLERIATDRLCIDIEAAKLPDFKPSLQAGEEPGECGAQDSREGRE